MNSKFLFLDEILKFALLYAIYSNDNRCTAKEIQEILGLKKQTTYNNLRELLEQGYISQIQENHASRPHILVSYYSLQNPEKIFHFPLIEHVESHIQGHGDQDIPDKFQEKGFLEKLRRELKDFLLVTMGKNLTQLQFLNNADPAQFAAFLAENLETIPHFGQIERKNVNIKSQPD